MVMLSTDIVHMPMHTSAGMTAITLLYNPQSTTCELKQEQHGKMHAGIAWQALGMPQDRMLKLHAIPTYSTQCTISQRVAVAARATQVTLASVNAALSVALQPSETAQPGNIYIAYKLQSS